MEADNIPNIFQEKISKLFERFYMARAYIDYVLLIPEHEFLDHLKSWGVFLQKLAESGLKVNADK